MKLQAFWMIPCPLNTRARPENLSTPRRMYRPRKCRRFFPRCDGDVNHFYQKSRWSHKSFTTEIQHKGFYHPLRCRCLFLPGPFFFMMRHRFVKNDKLDIKFKQRQLQQHRGKVEIFICRFLVAVHVHSLSHLSSTILFSQGVSPSHP